MTESLTPRDRVVLLALMALNEEVPGPVLKERAGFTLERATRQRLNTLKLVHSTKRGRAFWHELTDDGWAWCWAEMSRPAPARSDGGTRSLYTVLAGLRRFLEHADLHLSDVFGLPDDPDPDGPDHHDPYAHDPYADDPDADSPYPDSPYPGAGTGDRDGPPLDDRLRTAYRLLAVEPGDWVSLTEVRRLVRDAPRAAVDDALRRLDGSPDVHLVPETDQRRLTPADRAAAVRIGSRDRHLLKVD